MGPKTQMLSDCLKEVIQLLDGVGERYWSEWMAVALTQIEDADFSGIEHLRAAYGGMGSFNDILMHRLNGFTGTEMECRDLNERLERLRSEMWKLADYIRHNAEIR